MKKFDEMTKEGSCLNSALSNEIVFVLLARDAAAPVAIEAWAAERVRSGANQETDDTIVDARDLAQQMREQRGVVRAALGKDTAAELG